MSKVDWSKAPEGADFSAGEAFYKRYGELILFYDKEIGVYKPSIFHSIDMLQTCYSIEPRPQQWPSESRIDIIGTNGNTGESYMEETLHQTAKVHYETQAELAARLKAELEAKQKAELAAKSKTITAASDFLSEGLRILCERGKQYDPSGTKEMSFDNVAEAFNCLTNSRLKGSDVCLILALLKVVRQNANKDFHEDSAVDFVNYAALHSELVKSEK